jgi:hypothetical protein
MPRARWRPPAEATSSAPSPGTIRSTELAIRLHELGRELRAGDGALSGIAVELGDVEHEAAEELRLESRHFRSPARGVVRRGEAGDAFADHDKVVDLHTHCGIGSVNRES